MPDIRDYPELDSLDGWIADNFEAAAKAVPEIFDEPETDLSNVMDYEGAVIFGEWGRGTTREAQAPLIIGLVLSPPEGQEEPPPDFGESADRVMFTLQSDEGLADIEGGEPRTELMNETFDDIEFTPVLLPFFEETINRNVTVREGGDPNRAYYLTEDENIIVQEGGGILRQPAGVREDKVVESDILQYPELGELREGILSVFEDAKEAVAQDNEDNADDIRDFELIDAVFTGEWGNGNAEFSADPFDITLFIAPGGDKTAAQVPRFPRLARQIGETVDISYQPPELAEEWSSDVVITGVQSESFESVIESGIEEPDTERAYGLITNQIYELEPKEPFGFEVVSSDAETDIDVVDTEEEETEEEEVSEDEDKEEREPPRRERLKEEFPDINVALIPFIDEEQGNLEMPAGKKDTRQVEFRELYDFEIEMSEKVTEGEGPDEDFEEPATDIETYNNTKAEIGRAIQLDFVGAPVATFPRTSTYIRNRLLNEGMSYPLQMYREIVFYSGFISTKFGKDFRAGTYDSFREMIYRLNNVDERGGPELIRKVPQQSLAARGISVTPNLPNGQPAPWLENHSYYEIVEENADHPAWDQITEFIYGEDD